MKTRFIHSAGFCHSLPIAAVLGAAILTGRAEVIIDAATGNGGFASPVSGVNTGFISATGNEADAAWRATSLNSGHPGTPLDRIWINSGNSPLNDEPFGPDATADSRSIQAHHDAGIRITSTALFGLNDGDGIKLSFDVMTSGPPPASNPPETTLTISLIDMTDGSTLRTIGIIDSQSHNGAYTQRDFTASGLPAAENVALRFTLSNSNGVGRDFNLDRVHLETVPGEPNTLFWDTDGDTPGAGGPSPAGDWTGTNWTSSPAGDAPGVSWTAGRAVIFAAGTDATGLYTVNLGGAQEVASVRVQEGDVTLSGGTLILAAGGFLQADAPEGQPTILEVASAFQAADFTTEGDIYLSGANTVTGSLGVIGGILTLDTSLAVGDLTGDGSVVIGSAAVFTAGGDSDTIFTGLLSGEGAFVKHGEGKLQLSRLANSLAGDLTVAAGTLETGLAAGNGSTSYLGAVDGLRTVTVQSGAALRYSRANVFGGSGKSAGTIPALVIDGGTLHAERFNILGLLTLRDGAGLTNSSAEGTALFGGFQFLGDVTVDGSGAGAIIENTASALPNHLLGGASLVFTVDDITASPETDLTIASGLADGSGDYPGPAGLVKAGNGTLALLGANTYTGDTVVTGGILTVTGQSIADTAKLVIDGGKVDPIGTETVGALFFGDEPQAPGTWGATGSGAENIDDERFAGGGGIILVPDPEAGYDQWIAGFPGASHAPGFDQDADNDGVPNGLEWVLGTDPSSPSPGLVQVSATANSVTFRHRQSDDPAAIAAKSYEWSSDLVEWKTSGEANAAGTIGTIAEAPVDGGMIEVTVTASGAPTSKLFARLISTP